MCVCFLGGDESVGFVSWSRGLVYVFGGCVCVCVCVCTVCVCVVFF